MVGATSAFARAPTSLEQILEWVYSPGNSDQYIATKGASTKSEADTVIPIRWGKKKIYMYFQDGAYLIPSGVPGERSSPATPMERSRH
jgi:hypothetical protein